MLAAVFDLDEVKIVDCIALKLGYKDLFSQMSDFAPTWVVFNPISSTITHDMIVAHYGKALGAKTVAISPHTKALKEESHDRYPTLDFAVDYTKGGAEPEYKLRQLIKGISADGTRFEDLPPARQDLLPIKKYSLPFIGSNYTFVVTSRGCPWKCIYCRATVVNENKARFRPVKTVAEEIRRYGLKNIAFHADTATMNRSWMIDMCRHMPAGTRWICNSRVTTVDLHLLKTMKEAGCWMICYGIESGNDDVLKMNKKEATVEQARQAVKWAKQAGLQVWGYFMLGMYGDTAETMQQTIDLAVELSPAIANFSISSPYPGTEWGSIAQEKGWLVDKKWESYDQNYSAQVKQPGCSPSLIKEYQKKAYFRWYLSWRGVVFLFRGFRPYYFHMLIRVIWNHIKK